MIAVSFPSLIPSLILPSDDRENSDSTPHYPKVLFIKIAFQKILTPFLKKLTLFLKPLTYLFFKKKSPQKRFFLPISKKYCTFATERTKQTIRL